MSDDSYVIVHEGDPVHCGRCQVGVMRFRHGVNGEPDMLAFCPECEDAKSPKGPQYTADQWDAFAEFCKRTPRFRA